MPVCSVGSQEEEAHQDGEEVAEEEEDKKRHAEVTEEPDDNQKKRNAEVTQEPADKATKKKERKCFSEKKRRLNANVFAMTNGPDEPGGAITKKRTQRL